MMRKQTLKLRLATIALALAVALTFSFTFFEQYGFATAENPTQAEPLSFNKDVTDTFQMSQNYTSHYYKFTTPSYSGIDYIIRGTITECEGSYNRVDVYLLDEDYNPLNEDGVPEDYVHATMSGLGDTDNLTYSNLKPNTTYYVRVDDYYGPHKESNISYIFSW